MILPSTFNQETMSSFQISPRMILKTNKWIRTERGWVPATSSLDQKESDEVRNVQSKKVDDADQEKNKEQGKTIEIIPEKLDERNTQDKEADKQEIECNKPSTNSTTTKATDPRWCKTKLDFPADNEQTNTAATLISKTMRRWWQRLHYKIMLIQHKLDLIDQWTARDIKKIQIKTEIQKVRLTQEVRETKQATEAQLQQSDVELSQLIENKNSLRKENLQLRQMNHELEISIAELKEHNERMLDASNKADSYTRQIKQFTEHLKEANQQLISKIEKYEKATQEIEKSIEVHNQYSLTEQAIRLSYVNLLGTIIEKMQNSYACTSDDDNIQLLNELVAFLFHGP